MSALLRHLEHTFQTHVFSVFLSLFQLQKLQQDRKPSGPSASAASATAIPSGDDIRILLFARADREKEDWFRRFSAASCGAITDQELQFADMVFVNESDCVAALKAVAAAAAVTPISPNEKDSSLTNAGDVAPPLAHDDTNNTSPATDTRSDGKCDDTETVAGETDSAEKNCRTNSLFEGLLMTSCAARGPSEYIKFMSRYQVSFFYKTALKLWFVL